MIDARDSGIRSLRPCSPRGAASCRCIGSSQVLAVALADEVGGADGFEERLDPIELLAAADLISA